MDNAKKEEVKVTNKGGKVTTIMIHEYNNSMNGRDRGDISYYNTFSRKTAKWWKRMFA